MDFSSPHLGFIAMAYGLSALALLGLAIRIILRDRKLRRETERLKDQ